MQHGDSCSWSCDLRRESRAWAFSSHGAHAIEPLTLLSRNSWFTVTPLPLSWELQVDRPSFLVGSDGSEGAESAEITVDAAP